MPHLVLLRHAKSDWPPNVGDFERPLSQRGIRDCDAVAHYLNSLDIRMETAIVSPAKRTTQTFDLVQRSLNQEINCIFEPAIYEAHEQDLLEVIRRQSGSRLLLVGHGPGVPRLALVLAHNATSPVAQRLRTKYPTAAVAVLKSDLPWAEWTTGCAMLQSFEIPRANPQDSDND